MTSIQTFAGLISRLSFTFSYTPIHHIWSCVDIMQLYNI